VLSGRLELSPSVTGNVMKSASVAIVSRAEDMTQQLHSHKVVEVETSISRS
jgi:hypothetical protein